MHGGLAGIKYRDLGIKFLSAVYMVTKLVA